MISVIPLKYSQRADHLNKFDHGFLVVSEENISIHEWYNYRHNEPGGSSFHLCYYVHSLDAHYVVTDLNEHPIRVFHEFNEIVRWAQKEFIQNPKTKAYLCQLPAHKRKDEINHHYELMGIKNPREGHKAPLIPSK